MFLEQIERKLQKMIDERDKKSKDGPKKPLMRVVSSSEITPEKGLGASKYLGDVGDRRPPKTMGMKLPAAMHERIERIQAHSKGRFKSKKAVVLYAIKIGLQHLDK